MEKDTSRKFPISTKELVLVVIDVFSIAFLFILLAKLPQVAETLRQARIASVIRSAARHQLL